MQHVNLLNISHICNRFQIFKRHLEDATLVYLLNTVHVFVTFAKRFKKIQTFRRFESGESLEYFSHLQKLFVRFDFGESFEYLSHLQKI